MTLQYRFRLEEAASKSGLEPDLILQFVSRSWVHPADPEAPAFDSEDLARIQLIHDLRELMLVNDEAVPVILHLIDQLNSLHRRLKEMP